MFRVSQDFACIIQQLQFQQESGCHASPIISIKTIWNKAYGVPGLMLGLHLGLEAWGRGIQRTV